MDEIQVVVIATALAACGGSAPAPAPAAHADHGGHHGHSASHRFDDAQAWAKVFDDPARDAWQRPADVVALLDVRPGMTVADIGAGTGYFLPYLSRAAGPTGRVIATDLESAMVEHMKARAARDQLTNVEPIQVSPDDPGLPPAGVDRVLVVDVWHHIEDRGAYARALAAALRPGGIIAIVDFTLESQHGPPRHLRVPPDAVVADLMNAGLSVRVAVTALPQQYVVLGTRSQ
jgi:predicted methyltransferase